MIATSSLAEASSLVCAGAKGCGHSSHVQPPRSKANSFGERDGKLGEGKLDGEACGERVDGEMLSVQAQPVKQVAR